MTEYGLKVNAASTHGTDDSRAAGSISRMLSSFDGAEWWTLLAFQLPPGVATFNEYVERPTRRRDGWPNSYLQAAGAADAMTVDVTRQEVDGRIHHYTLGHASEPGEPSVALTFRNGEITAHVYPSEVFTAEEAIPIFTRYLLEDHFPSEYHLREIGVFDA